MEKDGGFKRKKEKNGKTCEMGVWENGRTVRNTFWLLLVSHGAYLFYGLATMGSQQSDTINYLGGLTMTTADLGIAEPAGLVLTQKRHALRYCFSFQFFSGSWRVSGSIVCKLQVLELQQRTHSLRANSGERERNRRKYIVGQMLLFFSIYFSLTSFLPHSPPTPFSIPTPTPPPPPPSPTPLTRSLLRHLLSHLELTYPPPYPSPSADPGAAPDLDSEEYKLCSQQSCEWTLEVG